MMRAARIHAYGEPDVLVVEEVPRPSPGPRDLLIEVHAAGVNPIDWKIRGGGQRGAVRLALPWTLGLDVSGVVVEVGDAVKGFAVGDEVFASPTHRRPGTYAEYVVIDERAVARKPSVLTHEEAAGIPLAGLTAWQCIQPIREGHRALILAGSGGVGTLAIQLAKDRGAFVATTCSARNAELVRELGADLVIDYTQQDFRDVVEGYDFGLDAIGGPTRAHLRSVLRRGGHLAGIVGGLPGYTKKYGPLLGVLATGWSLLTFKIVSKLRYGVTASAVLRKPSGAALAGLAERIEAGAVRPIVDRVFPLDEIAEAHRYSESGRARGKIIVKVR